MKPARRLFPLIVAAACQPAAESPSPGRTVPAITPADIRSRIFIVADDSMRGRQAGTFGNAMMTEYLAREMARLRLDPGGDGGTFFQNVPIVRRWTDSASRLALNGHVFTLFTDYALIRPTATLRSATRLPPGTYQTIYGGGASDSTVTLPVTDVTGRIVILDAPVGANGQPTGVYTTPMALAISRFPTAAGIAITALDLVSVGTATSLRGRGNGLAEAEDRSARRPFGLLLSAGAAERIIGSAPRNLRAGVRGQDLVADVRFAHTSPEAPARNVVAILRGSDSLLRTQYVAIGAHNDHEGVSARAVDHDSLRAYNRVMRPEGAQTSPAVAGNPTTEQWARIRSILDSLRRLRPPRLDSIFNGADDDGSGSVAMLEIAEALAQRPAPRRSILFVWHTAEESGLLGSAWFTGRPTVPADSIVAQLNMDMVGRGTERDLPTGGPRNIQVIGSRRLSTDLGNLVDSMNASLREPYRIDYSFDAPRHPQNRYCRSDHAMYARMGIPIAYMSRGYHQDYHMVTDEPQYISYEGLAGVASFVRDLAVAIADRKDRLRVDKPKPDPLAPCRQ